MKYEAYELDKIPEADCELIQDHLKEETGVRSVPNIWFHGKFFGDSSKLMETAEERNLFKLIGNHNYDYSALID